MKIKYLSLIICIITFASCTTLAKVENIENLQDENLLIENKFVNNLNVGQVISFDYWTPRVKDEDYKMALINSLKNNGLYNENGKYTIYTFLEQSDNPVFGATMTVAMNVGYSIMDSNEMKINENKKAESSSGDFDFKLFNVSSGQHLISTTEIFSYGSVTMKEIYSAEKRVVAATERAAYENIQLFLEYIKSEEISE